MRIGIITYYRIANFGANLQAVSTYRYLKKAGHSPIFIHYMSKQLYKITDCCYHSNPQIKTHLDFIDKVIPEQTSVCFTKEDINQAIQKYGIEAIIIGSDAVLQHHPFLSRIHLRGRILKRIHIEDINADRLFPNLFWGCGINQDIKKVLMSVSSQNSAFKDFSSELKLRMQEALSCFSYISARDTWTQKMIYSIIGKEVPLTPDPVFAFNENAGDMVPSREYILRKFHLPERYILVSFLNVNLPESIVRGIKVYFSNECSCVAFPSPQGIRFQHNYDHEVPLPLSPEEWYALIKYSNGYIGNNMHPIVVALHNNVPCFSIDNYSNYDFWGKPQKDGASKIEDLLSRCNLTDNHIVPFKGNTEDLDEKIYKGVMDFPKEEIAKFCEDMYSGYKSMMESIIKTISV